MVGLLSFFFQNALFRNSYKIQSFGSFVTLCSSNPLVDNIKMSLRNVGFGVVGWIRLALGLCLWQALVNTIMNLQIL
jgi:hypothetical protein